MTRQKGPQLPATVTLPDSAMIGAAHLRHALGVSKAVLHLWRKKYSFPAAHRQGREFYAMTDAVREWLERYGVKVAIR